MLSPWASRRCSLWIHERSYEPVVMRQNEEQKVCSDLSKAQSSVFRVSAAWISQFSGSGTGKGTEKFS